MRVRANRSGVRAAAQEPSLAVRVEYVNTRQAVHFNELSGAFDFIAESIRRNVLHPDP